MYIYIHLPFCSSICSYCDFSKLLYEKKYIDIYLKQLKTEILTRYQNEEVVSIYIGGGTPTCLTEGELRNLLELTKIFKRKKNIEFTIESNIECLTIEKIKLLVRYGVNRISLGVQSFQEDILKELNRHHNKEMVKDVVGWLKKEGISNISIDYIYGVNEDIHKIQSDMEFFLSLNLPHISCYSLIIEDNTVLKINNKKNIDEEIEENMYHFIEDVLEEHHYVHYEVSNYAKKGFESIHNINYWNNGEYYGFGLGAVSYLRHVRRSNTKNFSNYLKGVFFQCEEYEDESLQISNDLILGLRKIGGISLDEFEKKYHKKLLDCYDIRDLLDGGMLEIVDNYLRIPKKNIYISNEILIHFL